MPKRVKINGIKIRYHQDRWIDVTNLIVAVSLEHATESLFKYFVAGDHRLENGHLYVPVNRVAPIINSLDIEPLKKLLDPKDLEDKTVLFSAPAHIQHIQLDLDNPGQPLPMQPETGGFPVFYSTVNGVEVMRKDDLLNANQLLKAAQVDEQVTARTLKELQNRFHESVDWPSNRQGVWVPLSDARKLALQFNLATALAKLIDERKETSAEPASPQDSCSSASGKLEPALEIKKLTIKGVPVGKRPDGWIDLQAIIKAAGISNDDRTALLKAVLTEKLKKYEMDKGQLWADQAAAYDLAARLDLLSEIRPLFKR